MSVCVCFLLVYPLNRITFFHFSFAIGSSFAGIASSFPFQVYCSLTIVLLCHLCIAIIILVSFDTYAYTKCNWDFIRKNVLTKTKRKYKWQFVHGKNQYPGLCMWIITTTAAANTVNRNDKKLQLLEMQYSMLFYHITATISNRCQSIFYFTISTSELSQFFNTLNVMR